MRLGFKYSRMTKKQVAVGVFRLNAKKNAWHFTEVGI